MNTIATIEDALRSMADLPASVQTWDVEIGADATGDEAVWVWVTLQEEDLNRQTREQFRSLVRNAVRQQTSNSPLWVYVRFRGASEAVTFGQAPASMPLTDQCYNPLWRTNSMDDVLTIAWRWILERRGLL